MNRRDFSMALGAAGVGLLSQSSGSLAAMPVPGKTGPMFAMLIYPGMILLDLTGPMTVFNLTMGEICLVWKDRAPVSTDIGIPIAATHTFEECPRDLDVLFVPGGLGGTTALLEDEQTLAFVRERASSARFVTSVCTGSLVLGAAGLLKDRKATSHWYTKDMLSIFGAIPTEGRVVEDGNIITGGGVTAGIDFGLTVAARLRGDDWAKRVQLTLEYDPQPPYRAGSPDGAGEQITNDILKGRAPALNKARAASQRAGARLKP